MSFVVSVSIILRTFNRAHILSRAIDSVVAQSYPHWELLIIDNFSSDSTIDLITRYKDTRIKFFQFANHGIIAKSINYALCHASHDLIAILDSDDWWHSDKLLFSIPAFESGSDLVYHGCIQQRISPSKHISLSSFPRRKLVAPVFHDLLFNGNPIINSSVVFRKSLLLSISGFNESSEILGAEDFDAWLSLSLHTDRFTYIPHLLVFYSWGDDNLSNHSLSLRHTNYIINKYFSNRVLPPPSWACYKLASSYLFLHKPILSFYYFTLMIFSSLYTLHSLLSLPRYIVHYLFNLLKILLSLL